MADVDTPTNTSSPILPPRPSTSLPVRIATPLSPDAPNLNVNQLGFYLDGWGDLIEGMAEKAAEVRDEIREQLVSRNMPEIEVKKVTGIVGLLTLGEVERRKYTITTTYPGATTAIYIGEHGKDLFVSWGTYIKPIPNKKRLLIMLVIAVIPSLCFIVGAFLGVGAGVIRSIQEASPEGIFSALVAFLCSGFFILQPILAVFIFEAVILAIVGLYFRRDPLYYFIVVPNAFDANDIAAMTLSVHKSTLKALDKFGIDTSKLRLKQDFKRGSRGETI